MAMHSRPTPAHIRRVYEAPLKGKGDWVRRTRRARDLLIQLHGCKPDQFYEVGRGDEPCLDMSPLYPPHWADTSPRRRRRGRRARIPWVGRFPRGLILLNNGLDYWGEACDDQDPILVLADIEHWASLTDEGWKRWEQMTQGAAP